MQKNKNIKTNADKLKEEFYKGMTELDKRINRLERSQEKTNAEIDKFLESQKKTEKLVKQTNRDVGKLTDGWGKFVEGLVEPNVVSRFSEFGIKITGTYQRPKRHYNGETMELDILAVGRENDKRDENLVMAVEAVSNLTIKEIKETEKKLTNFFKFFNEYKGKKLIGVVAGVRLSKGVNEYAEKCGLYILSPSGDTMAILNKKDFKPKVWR